jgi:hypothetical protein
MASPNFPEYQMNTREPLFDEAMVGITFDEIRHPHRLAERGR